MNGRKASWRRLAMTALIIVANAAVQALTVVPGATPGLGLPFALLVLVSFAAFSASAALLSIAALPSRTPLRRPRQLPPVSIWLSFAAVVLAVALSTLISPVVLPIVTTIALIMAPALAAGAPHPRSLVNAFAAAPVRASLLTIVSIVVTVLGWIAAFALGFFVAGPWSALLTWIVLGAAAAALLHAWARLWARPRRSDDRL